MNKPTLYSKYHGLQTTDANYVLDNYIRLIKWKGQDNALDVGCGSGQVTTNILLPLLPQDFKKLVGLDISPEMVKHAKSQNENPKVDFIASDISSIDIKNDICEEFDHIFSFYCLHWVQNQRQTIKNMYNLLKPGGDVLLTFLANNPIFHIYEVMAKNPKWSHYMKNYELFISPYQHCEDPEKVFETMLIEEGFSVHQCKVVERNYTFPDMNVLKKSVIAVNPFINNIPENMKNDYIDDYMKEAQNLKYTHNDDNKDLALKVPYNLFIIIASKSS
ncbi:PREDICTED: juvenile hormone acid O-methyltransferase-like [Nicrophorus vespilloides]|uniref:Juvenile hormone acid O-methyltransferase-like n=1 Tax=Nicrophorus vespilloides TaxID=110193 RepID=A0ABM1MC57_NICVS|nr:PREDICTED: juvenile hormone acid O-methyltransferase-like [Nicrophorus vespilloides]